MKKLKMETKDIVTENIDNIAKLFPNVMTERKCKDGSITTGIDFEKLRQELSKDIIDENDERYEFTWVGKNKAIVDANEPIRKTLRPCVDESKNFDTTENLYIEGDNLEVLKILQESYLEQVKMIYIDPPYNTGKDSFVYNDKFTMDKDDYEEETDYRNEDGECQFKENKETNPRYHSAWCSMIYSRLKLAKNLLKEDGVIFISIDDNEVRNLRNIGDEIFGEGNFVGCFPWQSRQSIQNDTDISNNHEYILSYAKVRRKENRRLKETNVDTWFEEKSFVCLPIPLNKDKFDNPDNDKRGLWKADPFDAPNVRPNLTYKIKNPNNEEEYFPPSGRCWRTEEKNYFKYLKEDRIIFGKSGLSRPQLKVFYDEKKMFGTVSNTWWSGNDYGTTTEGTKELKKIFEKYSPFDTPKPCKLLFKILNLVSLPSNNDIILDFFSGSSTTADAVMQLNAEDGGNRKFIMVQVPQKTDEKTEAFKAGYPNICEIGKERIRRAGQKIEDEINSSNTQITLGEEPKTLPDTGFRVLKVDDSNMKDIYYSANEISQTSLGDTISNIKEDRNGLDLLFGILLDWGLELSYQFEITTIDDITVYNYDNGSLVACLDDVKVTENCIKEIAKLQPLRVVFRDSCFQNSASKINLEEIFKSIYPDTEIKVI